ncbi:MAG TPA: hypothetical protein VK187_09665 [Geobacteraceae bacterium]|nr:hypothetical protein [Geobacteraceae bacterium]
MAEKDALEQRIEELTKQLEALSQRVNPLEAKLEQPAEARQPAAPAPASHGEDAEPEDISEEILTWARRTALLPRLSTLCFLLVVALILRTITDNNIINTLAGSALGMGYAAILIAAGWYKYRQTSPLAPVFAACGAFLMSIIVVETHAHFQSLPLVPAYITLIATGAAMAIISYQFNVFVPISLGTLGMCLAGAAIDFPNPYFPYLAMVLWTANILGYFAARLKRCSWLRWILLLVTMMMMSQWGLKLGMLVARKETLPESLAVNWFLPLLGIFAATYLGIALWGILYAGESKVSRFDFSLPTINVVLAFSLASYGVHALGSSGSVLGWVGIAGAAAHFILAFWLAGRKEAGGVGSNTFAFAGAALLSLALAKAMGNYLLALPILAVVAFFLAILSRTWENGGLRLTSYLLQLYAFAALAMLVQNSATAVDFLTVIPAGLLAVISLYHFQWCRRFPPPEGSGFFAGLDRHDHSAVVLFLAALASGFFMLRACVYQVLVLLPKDAVNTVSAFRCSQSILINGAAAVLMLFALRRKNKEIRNIAILITCIGAMRVFLYDMMGTRGIPLVLSVFTFGLVAALESIALGRWSRKPADKNETTGGGQTPLHQQ